MILSKEDKNRYCSELAEELPVIRKMMNLSQADLAEHMDLARATISAMEYKKKMTWIQYTSLLFIIFENEKVKKYLYEQKLCPKEVNDFLEKYYDEQKFFATK